MERLLTEQQGAALLNVSVKTLQGWRLRGGGPRFRKMGRCVRYAVADLEAYVEQAVRQSTSERGLAHAGQCGIRVEHLLEQTGRTSITRQAGARPVSPSSARTAAPAPPTPRRHVVRLTAHRVTVRGFRAG